MIPRWWRATAIVVAFASTPAHADNYVLRFTGSGFKAGESCTTPSTVSMSLSGTVDTGHHAGSYTFSFAGATRTCGITETGSGALSGDVAGSVTYERTAVYLQLFGYVSLSGTTVLFNATCGYLPTSVNPTTFFTVACVADDATL